ncbi:hypothetical protein PRIPAC_76779 [Pristionchus pacificus]|nr:hypothetical protein PRIPAC_76779 [Pristionchus pacificus]|eukprot:PDM70466.1 hypothetical protein PRIPAC_46712 [Pristionchus pacificus]
MKSKLTASKIRNPHLVLEQDPPVDQGDVQIEIAMARLLAVPERELTILAPDTHLGLHLAREDEHPSVLGVEGEVAQQTRNAVRADAVRLFQMEISTRAITPTRSASALGSKRLITALLVLIAEEMLVLNGIHN